MAAVAFCVKVNVRTRDAVEVTCVCEKRGRASVTQYKSNIHSRRIRLKIESKMEIIICVLVSTGHVYSSCL